MNEDAVYTPSRWYWTVAGDQTQVFSSAANAYVPVSDDTYVTWVASGNLPTAIDTLESLQQVLTDAAVPPYAPITSWQARKALRAAGLLTQVNAVVAAATPDLQDAWEYATTIHRISPLISALAPQLNLDAAALDKLFVLAASL